LLATDFPCPDEVQAADLKSSMPKSQSTDFAQGYCPALKANFEAGLFLFVLG